MENEAEQTNDRLFSAFVRFQKSPNGSGRQEVLDAMWRCRAPSSKDINGVYGFLLLHKPKSKGAGCDTIMEIARWISQNELDKAFARHWPAVKDIIDDAIVQVNCCM